MTYITLVWWFGGTKKNVDISDKPLGFLLCIPRSSGFKDLCLMCTPTKTHGEGSTPCPMTDPWEWYIFLHEWLFLMVNVGKYTIRGSYGLGIHLVAMYRWMVCNPMVLIYHVSEYTIPMDPSWVLTGFGKRPQR